MQKHYACCAVLAMRRRTSACALLVVLKARATKVLAEIMSMASALKSGVENAPISVRLTSVSTSRPFIRAPHKHSMSDVKPALGVSLFEDGPAPINAAVGATTHSTSIDVGSMHVQVEKIRDPVHVLRYTKKAAVWGGMPARVTQEDAGRRARLGKDAPA